MPSNYDRTYVVREIDKARPSASNAVSNLSSVPFSVIALDVTYARNQSLTSSAAPSCL